MPRELHLPPSAASLSASLRDIGYTLETAIADLVDNSIAAGAQNVDVYCDPEAQTPALAVIDDGCGMSQDEIVDAMRLGGNRKQKERSDYDLGKFGLGLKTASFSQCRRLIVVSRKDGKLSGIDWDLDVLETRDSWIVRELDSQEISQLPFSEQLPANGTLVLWQKLDRLFEALDGRSKHEVVCEKIAALDRHLGLVFHRFLAGTVQWHGALSLRVNGHPIRAFDPFCRDHPATLEEAKEIMHVAGEEVTMVPFILPHHSKLKAHVFDQYKDRSDFVANQGVYVYRNCRLIAWGGWFRLRAKSEATKLARVQIDFPSILDEHWTIDIKKSSAIPPKAVRDQLRCLVDSITNRSIGVIKNKGRRPISTVRFPVWDRLEGNQGVRYALSTRHPLVNALMDRLKEDEQAKLKLLLAVIAAALPVEAIYADHAIHPGRIDLVPKEESSILTKLELLRKCLPNGKESDSEKFLAMARQTKLFEQAWPEVEEYVGGWS